MGGMSSFQQLRTIYEAVKKYKKVNLFGPPGVGKTWQANRVSHRYAREKVKEKAFDFSLWVFLCRDYDKKSLSESIARQLGLLAPTQEWNVNDDGFEQEDNNEAYNLETLIEKIREKLRNGKILLFLDDVINDETEEEIEEEKDQDENEEENEEQNEEGNEEVSEEENEEKSEEENEEDNQEENETRFWPVWSEILPASVDDENLHMVWISRSKRKVKDVSKEISIEVTALPTKECESLLMKRLDAQLTPSAVTLGKLFVEKRIRLPGEVIMMAKVLNNCGLHKSKVSMLEKELEEKSKTYDVRYSLCRIHNALPLGVLKDLCQRNRHFFRDSGSIHYNELITYWILEGYLGFGSVTELYEKGHRVLMELTDCSILKRQECGYVFMDKSVLKRDDLYQCIDQTANLGLATVYKADTKGFGMIIHEDGMLKAAQVATDQKKKQKNSSELEDPNLRTLLIDGTHFSEDVMIKYLESQKELEVVALLNPTIKSLPGPLKLMKSLRVLVLRGCEFLQDMKIPLDDLIVLEISGAKSLKKLPFKFFKNMLKLQSLHLSKLPITLLPSSIYGLTELRWLIVKDCPSLKKIGSLADLKHLRAVDLSGNTSLSYIDKNFVELKKLRSLNLSNTLIPTTPILKNSEKLGHLLVRNCKELGRLRGLTKLKSLQSLDLSGSTLFEDFHDSSLQSLVCLRTLDLSGTNLEVLPLNIAKPRYLYLKSCTRLEKLPCIENLVNLEILDVSGSKNLNKINEEFFKHMTGLQVLNLSDTNVSDLPSLSNLINLRELLLSGCKSLVELPTLESATKLEVLDASNCTSLKDLGILSFESKTRLEKLDLSGTNIISLPSLSHLKNLHRLLLKNATNLENLDVNVALPNLVELNLSGITSLASNRADFLNHTSNIQILDLSFTPIAQLPLMSNLMHLTHVSLVGCSCLKKVPDLNSLTKLEVLDLSGSSVDHLPKLGRSRNFRKLLLKDCPMVEDFPHVVNDILGSTIKIPQAISALSHLEYLEFPDIKDFPEVGNRRVEYSSEEVNLDQWNICLLSDTDKPPMFFSGNQYLQILKRGDFPRGAFHFCAVPYLNVESEIGDKYLNLRRELVFADIYLQATQFARYNENGSLQIRGFDNCPKGIEFVIKHVDLVFFIDDNFKSLESSGLSANVLSKFKDCWIERCNQMVTVFNEKEGENDAESVMALENLGITNNHLLESIYNGKQSFGRLNSLKTLYLDCCPNLSTIFSSSWLPKTLEVLRIKYCDKLEAVFEGEGELPNLETLHLWELPELKTIDISFPSLKTLKLGFCTSLINVSSSSPPPKDIEIIDVRSCGKLQTLFAHSNSDGYGMRNLNRLHLEELPMLENVGSTSYIKFNIQHV